MKEIIFLGIPYTAGQPHSGVAEGASFFRAEGYLKNISVGRVINDLGDIILDKSSEKTLNQNAEANALISSKIENLNLKDSILISMGGDHGMGLGTVHGMLTHHQNLIVIWADAHGDINTLATSSTGNFHGMPLSYLLGLGTQEKCFYWMKHSLSARNLILMGARSLDKDEKTIIKENEIEHQSCISIEKLDAILKKLDPQSKCPIHLSLDIDLFDPSDVMATGCLVKNGPRKEDVFELGRFLGKTGRLVSVDVVELNPELGEAAEIKKTFSVAAAFLKECLQSF